MSLLFAKHNDCFTENYFVLEGNVKDLHMTHLFFPREESEVYKSKTINFKNKEQLHKFSDFEVHENGEYKEDGITEHVSSKEAERIERAPSSLTLNLNESELKKRYSMFDTFRSILIKNYPGCYIPKMYTEGDKHTHLEDIMREISKFMVTIQETHNFYDSELVRVFFDGRFNLTMTLKKCSNVSIDQIIERYRVIFSHLSGHDINQEIMDKISAFHSAVAAAIPILKTIKQKIEAVISSLSNERRLLEYSIKALMDMEHLFTEKYHPLKEAMSASDGLTGMAYQDGEFYKDFLGYISYQILDHEAMLDTLQTLTAYRDLRMSWVKKLDKKVGDYTITTGRSPDKSTKATDDLKDLDVKVSKIDLLVNIMTLNIAYQEIERFKVEKFRNYCEAVKRFSKSSISQKSEILGFFSLINNLLREERSPLKKRGTTM